MVIHGELNSLKKLGDFENYDDELLQMLYQAFLQEYIAANERVNLMGQRLNNQMHKRKKWLDNMCECEEVLKQRGIKV